MHPVLRNIAAVIAGLIVGSLVNSFIVLISGQIVPLPEGVDNTTTEGLRQGMQLMGPQHFIFPFFAHAIGTLVGAFIAAWLSVSARLWMSIIVGVLFLAGGILMVIALPSPLWFNVVDLTLAYIPMAYLGFYLAPQLKQRGAFMEGKEFIHKNH